jgi:hypothetical protein
MRDPRAWHSLTVATDLFQLARLLLLIAWDSNTSILNTHPTNPSIFWAYAVLLQTPPGISLLIIIIVMAVLLLVKRLFEFSGI